MSSEVDTTYTVTSYPGTRDNAIDGSTNNHDSNYFVYDDEKVHDIGSNIIDISISNNNDNDRTTETAPGTTKISHDIRFIPSCCIVIEFVVSLCLPILCKPIIGIIYIIRTLLFGYILQYAVVTTTSTTKTTTTTTTKTIDVSTQKWYNNYYYKFLEQNQSIDNDKGILLTSRCNNNSNNNVCITKCSTGSSTNNNSRSRLSSSSSLWPPPTLIGLALLTIMAFIVHPDGYTWIIIYKLRDAIHFVAKSLTSIWAVAVHDYGSIISTILALSTFATLFFFCYVLHQTLKSRTDRSRLRRQQNQKRSEKQNKRKKRKNTHVARVQANANNINNTGRPVTPGGIQQVLQDSLDNTLDNVSDVTYKSHVHVKVDDSVLQQQHVLPPLAEDEPLDALPISEALLITSFGKDPEYDTSSQYQTIQSPRSRTASSSTSDSFVCGSADDQSSCCSGRSTPTAISANEGSQFGREVSSPSTTIELSNSRIKSGGDNNPTNSTPNRSSNSNSRRSQRNRNNKKSNHRYLDGTATATSTTPPPPRLTPSKRWDALKPSNRVCSSNNNVTRYNHQGYNQTSSTKHDNSTVPVELLDSRKGITTPEQPKMITAAPLISNHTGDVKDFIQTNVVATGNFEVLQPNDSNSNINLNITRSAGRNVHDNNSFIQAVNTYDHVPTLSGLNPNSPIWTGRYNVVHHQGREGDSFYGNRLNTESSAIDSASHFGYNPPNNPSPSLPIDNTLYPSNLSSAFSSATYQQHSSYFGCTLFNQPHDSSRYKEEESIVGTLQTSSADLSFLTNLQRNFHNSNDQDSVPSMYSSMMTPSTAMTATSSSSTISTSYHRPSQQHAIVRDNPFANSFSDDDDDQIEAKLHELGGQMIGSILDF